MSSSMYEFNPNPKCDQRKLTTLPLTLLAIKIDDYK